MTGARKHMLKSTEGTSMSLAAGSQHGSAYKILAITSSAIAVVSFTACSNQSSEPVTAGSGVSTTDQGGQPNAEQEETQAKTIAFKDYEQLFVENGEQATFDAIAQAIALSEAGDVEGSAQILAGIGLNQGMVERALMLEGNAANNETLQRSYEKLTGSALPTTATITAALSPEVIALLPPKDNKNYYAQTSENLIKYFYLIPESEIDSETTSIIKNAEVAHFDLERSDKLTPEEKKVWIDYLAELANSSNSVRSQEGLQPLAYRSGW